MEQARKIIHVDMDAFYASVEQRDNPELQNKAIAVGGESERGVVAAASYEARKFGVRSAMSGEVARRLCPDLIFVKPRFPRYKEVSRVVHSIFHQFTDLVEALSLDEAYLDVTNNKKGIPSATLIAEEIRTKIYELTGLTASAGISINKFLAKVASDYNKPNGQKTIPPEDVICFLSDLDVRKFHGVGKVTADKMYRKGWYTGADLRNQSLSALEKHFGKSGQFYYDVVRGIHLNPVRPQRKPKSVGAERTFDENISSEVFMVSRLEDIASALGQRLLKTKVSGKTITLKIKYSDFVTQTRSKTVPYYTADIAVILEVAKELLFQEKLKNSVRLLGISLSNFKKRSTKKKVEAQLKLPF
ncbi:MAG: DNA polymerase IV [Legionellales bacterium]|nr:DNA polymerase IV [Legionellales bacterium]